MILSVRNDKSSQTYNDSVQSSVNRVLILNLTLKKRNRLCLNKKLITIVRAFVEFQHNFEKKMLKYFP